MSRVGEEIPLEPLGAEETVLDDYRLMSTAVVMRGKDRQLIDAFRWHLSPFRRSEPVWLPFEVQIARAEADVESDPGRFFYIRSGRRLFRGPRHELLSWALWDLHALVHREGRDFLFLHAGAVAAGDTVIVLPAAPDAGKSTLVASLLQLGFGYLSDELAAIDPISSRVHPFPKHLTLDADALGFLGSPAPSHPADYPDISRELPDRYFRPTDLGSRTGEPGPAAAIVFVDADRSGAPVLSELPRAEALTRLLEHALNMEVFGERGVKLLSRVVGPASAYSLTGGSTAERAALVRERFS
jgi:hypothetical protein